MTAAEKTAKLEAYTAAIGLLHHHAQLCTEASSLVMDLEASLYRHISALAEITPSDAPSPAKKGKANG